MADGADREIAQVEDNGAGQAQQSADPTVELQDDFRQRESGALDLVKDDSGSEDIIATQRRRRKLHDQSPASKIDRDRHQEADIVGDTGTSRSRTSLPVFRTAERMWRMPRFSEGLAAVPGPLREGAPPVARACSDALGYIDVTGAWVIPPRFRHAEDFKHGIARVKDADGKPYYYIDRAGKAVPEEVVRQLQPELKGIGKDGKRGYVNTRTGKIVATYEFGHEFREGMVRVGKKHKGQWVYGFIDATGRMIVPPTHFNARDFHEGLAAMEGEVTTSGSDGGTVKWGFIARTGEFVIPPQYGIVHDFSEGLAAVNNDGKFGYIDSTGKVVIPIEFEYATKFSEGLAAVLLSADQSRAAGLPGVDAGWRFRCYIDRTGRRVMPGQFFYEAEPFNDGLAYVSQAYISPEGFYGFINHEGRPVIDLRDPGQPASFDPDNLDNLPVYKH